MLDRNGTVLLRSQDPHAYIGKPGLFNAGWPTTDFSEGTLLAPGLDGVVRLNNFVTIAGTLWRVVAGLPEKVVFANCRDDMQRKRQIGADWSILGS